MATGTGTKMVKEHTTRQEEMRWVATEGKRYEGLWVVVEGYELFASGSDAKALYDQARAAGIDCPFIVRIPTNTNLPFAGW